MRIEVVVLLVVTSRMIFIAITLDYIISMHYRKSSKYEHQNLKNQKQPVMDQII